MLFLFLQTRASNFLQQLNIFLLCVSDNFSVIPYVSRHVPCPVSPRTDMPPSFIFTSDPHLEYNLLTTNTAAHVPNVGRFKGYYSLQYCHTYFGVGFPHGQNRPLSVSSLLSRQKSTRQRLHRLANVPSTFASTSPFELVAQFTSEAARSGFLSRLLCLCRRC